MHKVHSLPIKCFFDCVMDVNQVLIEVFQEHSDWRVIEGRLENRSRPWMVNWPVEEREQDSNLRPPGDEPDGQPTALPAC